MLKKQAKKIIKYSVEKKIPLIKNIIEGISFYYITLKNGTLVYFDKLGREQTLSLIRQIKEESGMLLQYEEAFNIFSAVKNTQKLKGDIAEVGVYSGGSAKIICEAKGEKKLFLFDTFEGLPEIDNNIDDANFYMNKFSFPVEKVRDYLRKYDRVYIYKGLFPKTAKPVRKKVFSFVHLDVDLYKSTMDCLKFFYPRMETGGIIISHDYPHVKGVRKAFDEFFKKKREPIIELLNSQCLIVKTEDHKK